MSEWAVYGSERCMEFVYTKSQFFLLQNSPLRVSRCYSCCTVQGRIQKNQKEGVGKCLGESATLQHITGILGPIEKYHSKDSWLQKFFNKIWRGGGRLVAPSPPSKSAHAVYYVPAST